MRGAEIWEVTLEYRDRTAYELGTPKPAVYDAPMKEVTVLVGVPGSWNQPADAVRAAIEKVIGPGDVYEEWQPHVTALRHLGSAGILEYGESAAKRGAA